MMIGVLSLNSGKLALQQYDRGTCHRRGTSLSQNLETAKPSHRQLITIIVLGLVALLAVVGGIYAFGQITQHKTGAKFSASKQVDNLGIAGASMDVEFPNGSNLSIANLEPGVAKSVSFTVQNNSTIPGDGLFGQPLGATGFNQAFAGVNPADYPQLKVRIQGNGIDTGWESAVSMPGETDLGYFGVGDTKWFTVSAQLDTNAGNEWQGFAIYSHPTVTINQHD